MGLTPFSCPVTNTCAAAAVALAPPEGDPQVQTPANARTENPVWIIPGGRGCSGLLPSFRSASLLLGVTSAGTLQCRAAGSPPTTSFQPSSKTFFPPEVSSVLSLVLTDLG